MNTSRKRDGLNMGLVFLITLAVLAAILLHVLLIWWLVWSIVDLANGNPATGWNVLGIVIPVLSIGGGWLNHARS